MSSPPASSSFPSEISSSSTLSQSNTHESEDVNQSYQHSTEPEELTNIHQLQNEGIHYAADDYVRSQCEFVFKKDIKGEILAPKDKDAKFSEFILTGVFEIDPRSFFMTSDGKWNCNNPLNTRFEQVKPTCHLLPVMRNEDFSFSTNDFPTILSNLRAMKDPRKSRDTYSVILSDTNAIKLTHRLFTVNLSTCFISLLLVSIINPTILGKEKFF